MPRPTTRQEVLSHLRDVVANKGVIVGAGAGKSTGLARQQHSSLTPYTHYKQPITNFYPRNWPLSKGRRGRRMRPNHHLQLRPLSDGRPRLSRRPDALR
ncbi:hypothetical protein KEM55_005919 [Ascosphaera atra]|nr:hypothetical protein KEM55_005919 [Ascosphaera atra]